PYTTLFRSLHSVSKGKSDPARKLYEISNPFVPRGLRPDCMRPCGPDKEGDDSPMSVEDEFEETRRALHRMLKDAFEGKLGVFREPFIYGFTTRTRETLKYTTTNGVLDVVIARRRAFN